MVAAALVPACGDPATSVRLEIIAAPALSLDGLSVTIEGARYEQSMSETLQLLVPERWAGREQRIEVDGTQRGMIVAFGAVVVTPIAREQVTGRVTLVASHCAALCTVGTQRCDMDAVVTCELGADDCPIWSAPSACPGDTPFCSNGRCSDVASTTLDAGGFHTCEVRTAGTVVCWGSNSFGKATPPSGAFRTVTAGLDHSCGVKSSGSVACWGNNTSGQANPPAGNFATVTAGAAHMWSQGQRSGRVLGSERRRASNSASGKLCIGDGGIRS